MLQRFRSYGASPRSPFHASQFDGGQLTPGHFSVAAPTVRSDDRNNGEGTSAQPRYSVVGGCGILAPLPGLDRHPPKPKWVNHFSKNLASQLNTALLHQWMAKSAKSVPHESNPYVKTNHTMGDPFQAMINVCTGEFKLDDHKLIICPDLTLLQFKAGDIPIGKSSVPTQLGWCLCWFEGEMDGVRAKFTIQFRFEQLHRLLFKFSNINRVSAEELRKQMNGWLLRTIGRPPPYAFDWGLISSAQIDQRSGLPSIIVTFKNGILDMGFKDVQSFYEYLRIQ